MDPSLMSTNGIMLGIMLPFFILAILLFSHK